MLFIAQGWVSNVLLTKFMLYWGSHFCISFLWKKKLYFGCYYVARIKERPDIGPDNPVVCTVCKQIPAFTKRPDIMSGILFVSFILVIPNPKKVFLKIKEESVKVVFCLIFIRITANFMDRLPKINKRNNLNILLNKNGCNIFKNFIFDDRVYVF